MCMKLPQHFPDFPLVAQMVKDLPAMWETQVWSLGQEDPLEQGMATHSSILAWRIPMNRGAWQATGHKVSESEMTEWLSTTHRSQINIIMWEVARTGMAGWKADHSPQTKGSHVLRNPITLNGEAENVLRVGVCGFFFKRPPTKGEELLWSQTTLKRRWKW